VGAAEVVADLNVEDFASALTRLNAVATTQLNSRRKILADYAARSEAPPLDIGSPCLHCLQSFGKIPWQNAHANPSTVSLPVL
jgi:hypothetical protein